MLVRDDAPELRLVYNWLDSWSGVGLIIAGMIHQGWGVQLTAYAARDWRATPFRVGIAHSIAGGSAVGADAVEGGASGGVGGVEQGGEVWLGS